MVRTERMLFSVVLCWVIVASGMVPLQPRHGRAVFVTEDATLADLQDLNQLRDLFNERAGVPRLILLLSPT